MSEEGSPVKDIIVVHGDVCIRKERKKRRKLLLWELLYDFSRNTTLHGLRYVTDRGLSVFEKVFWFITFMTSMSVCFYFIYNVYDKWQSTPVIVTISENLVPVTEIPLPSVTICPQTKCRRSVHDYSAYQKKTDSVFKKWLFNAEVPPPWFIRHIDLTTVCQSDVIFDYILSLMSTKNPRNMSLVEHLEEVAEPLDSIFLRCHWRDQKFEDCSSYFKKVLTQEGVCYNFNSLSASEIFRLENVQTDYSYLDAGNESMMKGWHPYYGYLSRDRESYPRRGRMNGASPDLDLILKRNATDKDELCNTLYDGYKIYIHHPADMPKSSLYYYAALDDQSSSLAVKCSILNTSSKLLGKTVDERKCYFEGERNLTYFKMYTAKNCMLECLSNYTFYKCGCVGFYMPHNDSDHLCHMGHTDCVSLAEDELANVAASINTEDKTTRGCNCLPSCYTVDYEAEVLKTDYKIEKLFNKIYYGNDTETKFSRIVLFFQQPEFVSMRRSELFGKTDFIANCGGLLGLFFGFSVLSIVEIVYFVTFRLWCTLRRDLKQEKKTLKKMTKRS